MKKKMLSFVAVACLLLFGAAGQAMAYFEDGNLMRVVYDKSGVYEIATDLGSGYNFTSVTTTNYVLNDNNFSLSQLGLSDWSGVYVAYFTMTQVMDTADGLWLSGNDTGGMQTAARPNWSPLQGVVSRFQVNNWLAPQNVNLQSDPESYPNLFGITGTFGGYIGSTSAVKVDTELSALDSIGYVDSYLYYYATPGSASSGLEVCTIRTYADGHTEINPVPVPPAAYLLGSGLLGLIRIRRNTGAA